ncbi:hypothetical protein [Chroococcidiopsis thermalis]|uniref:Uncharacterized protein n=1 Tax=Chroococcidiopsis thermalis (strain PCC 7203) TaxID=251229 RepID=K9TVV6_CHRTP|nr:hypothetical protein [Chroococcidiopsis thermalis]AFY86700.1 hypothetical protein Chro_1173 [Chroococcidiopsis thermalis PCC 7203]
MDAQEKELLQEMVGELRIQRYKRDIDQFAKYPRLQKQLELALLGETAEIRNKKLEALLVDLPEGLASQIKNSFLDNFQDYREFVEQGKKEPLYPPRDEFPMGVTQAVDKLRFELHDQVRRDVEVGYSHLMAEAKAKDAKLSKGLNGRSQTQHQAALETQMILEEHKRLESPAIRDKLLAEERRLLAEYKQNQRSKSNPLLLPHSNGASGDGK